MKRVLTVGGETLSIHTQLITDFKVGFDRENNEKSIETIKPKKYFITLSDGLQYIADSFAEFKDNLRTIVESLKEDQGIASKQATLYDFDYDSMQVGESDIDFIGIAASQGNKKQKNKEKAQNQSFLDYLF